MEFSLYKWRIPLVTSTNGLPETKFIVSEAVLVPSKGVESLVDRLDEEVAELFSIEGDVSVNSKNYYVYKKI